MSEDKDPEDWGRATFPHPFTPDVVEWARDYSRLVRENKIPESQMTVREKAARQILAAVGEKS